MIVRDFNIKRIAIGPSKGLLKFSEFYCLSHVYEMSDANDDSE